MASTQSRRLLEELEQLELEASQDGFAFEGVVVAKILRTAIGSMDGGRLDFRIDDPDEFCRVDETSLDLLNDLGRTIVRRQRLDCQVRWDWNKLSRIGLGRTVGGDEGDVQGAYCRFRILAKAKFSLAGEYLAEVVFVNMPTNKAV